MCADSPMVSAVPYAELVYDLIAEVLTVPRSDVHAGSALMQDLGAESIDFMDLVFRIEDAIGRKIKIGTWERYVEERLPEGDHAHSITAEIVREFAEREACRC
ncbi:MAG: phosphopantetheine-binding protein [Gemmatimonadota bacterium]|nr:phosphopantetheine-binding protein [Gemmatimonadota bacterium]